LPAHSPAKSHHSALLRRKKQSVEDERDFFESDLCRSSSCPPGSWLDNRGNDEQVIFPSGREFVMIKSADDGAATIFVLTELVAELRRRQGKTGG